MSDVANHAGWKGGVYRQGDFEVSTDRNRLDRAVIINTLSETYWAGDVSPERIMESVANGFPFGLYHVPSNRQIGFARLVTDMTRFAWVSDVFVIDAFKGQGCGKLLMQAILDYPPFENVYNWTLATKDAHGFYEQFGFQLAEGKDATMQLKRPKKPVA
ncbi:Histone acetyltransferase HPA2 and related acetyltransferases [Candidatus Phaeomarinobacter ectocarpi]|uniref:Histone acetyltransferase HPA2 and related acetyltransferases n=1 Tax=Candidatus Phaeomarinibacter ectocarpi TaxID=1458461 RepID=X5MER1_9HYPH|nr:GNAT family N-acetyltransferase [Candidatus Phaeomarinobacter ectocarpi]CDO61092.1 Histone acetyltransferase HPA2 and related acetyltransferases [Candidatus Phaeomarinobacter ectocarpi]